MNIKLKKTKKTKKTTGDKVIEIVRLAREIYGQIYRIDESNNKAIRELEEDYEKKVKEIINS